MRSTKALNLGAFALSGSFMVVFPLLPALQERSGITTAQLGWIATAGFVAALVAQLVIAPHADRGRERLVIGGSIVVMALSTLTYAISDHLAWFVAGRIGAGLAYGAFIPAAVGLIVRHFPDRQGERIGRLQALDLAGMAVGPLLAVGGKMWLGVEPTLVIAAVLTVLVGLPALLVRWEPTVAEAGEQHQSPIEGLSLLRHRSVIAAALLTCAFMIPIGAYDALFPRFLTDLDAPEWMLGAALTVFAVPSIFLAAWSGRQVDRHGPFTAAARGGAANVAIIVSYGFVRLPWVIVATGLLESGGQLLVGAAAAAAMGVAVPGRRAATAQGLGEGVGTLAGAVVAAIAAPLYAFGGPAALFLTTAVLTAGALVGGVRLGRTGVPVEERLTHPVGAAQPAEPVAV